MGNIRSTPTSSKNEDIEKFSHFSPEDIETWSASFKLTFPSRKITLANLEKQLQEFFPFGNSQNFSKLIFKTINISGTDSIDFHELLIAFSILTKGSSFEKLRWIFRFYDCDNDGVVSKSEMVYACQALFDMVGATLHFNLDAKEVVENVFVEVENLSGFLTFEDFRSLALKKSKAFQMLSNFNVE
ncbi:recoverin-like calcium-binding protein [Tubulinosema ratisbonensis]|uniref:Recoverin-like calcium-binding protein n=2 Tax=Tubulinosema ratisbonensis TaxID=291195 RepID=A0A437ALY4_9MICR|nr:recoverin-like calcium-binding protein [Tubulinosema ratisbonensis]